MFRRVMVSLVAPLLFLVAAGGCGSEEKQLKVQGGDDRLQPVPATPGKGMQLKPE
jgi:hypothetical protein